MKCSIAIVLMSLLTPFSLLGSPVAHIEQVEQGHYLRGFRRVLLDVGSTVESGDVIEVDRGLMTLQLSGESWTFSEGSKLRLKKSSGFSSVELMQGSLYVSHQSGRPFEVNTPIAILKGSGAELYLSLENEGLELAHLKGELKWKSRGHRMKEKSHTLYHRSRLEKGLSRPVFSSLMKGLDMMVYQQLLQAKSLKLSGPLELDSGELFLPKDDLLFKEQLRREQKMKADGVTSTFSEFQEQQRQSLLRGERKDLREVMKVESAFEFPVPLAPPPTQ